MNNPLLQQWKTPFGTPPFDQILPAHFKPAIEETIKSTSAEIEIITENPDPATFENTVAALDRVGENLSRVSSVLFNLNSAETSTELQIVAREVSPLLTRFSNDITLNDKLFSRIKSVYDGKSSSGLSTEQSMLLERKFRGFMLGGAGLDELNRKRFREISEELSQLSLEFEENVLAETNSYQLHLTDSKDLSGLPDGIIEAAAQEAKNRNKDGWIFTLQFPSYVPFMQYSDKRLLRKEMLKAYSSRACHGNDHDNSDLISKIVNLRLELAMLLGFSNFAGMVLGDRMAETPENVGLFLDNLFTASHPAAVRDFERLREYAIKHGHQGEIERWDWAYYSEKLKKELFDIDDEILKPYFRLEHVQKAIFDLATKLYNIRFQENKSIPVYNPDIKTWEVHDEDGSLLAIFYADFHPRTGKSGGAWMTSYRDQRIENNEDVRPFISIVTNFSRAGESKPSLLTFSELTTFLHEFGHALHGMLSRCTYESLSGTSVYRDFVELPSQFMENWAFEQEWLDTWAVHYETGEKIPFELIKKIKEASTYNEGYSCDRQLGFGFLDMAWHTISEPVKKDIAAFEREAMKKTNLFPEIENANMSCSFGHLFGGGYAAGYYGYKWAEVLDADAFSYFRETGLFNKETAALFRKNILEKGGSDKPLNLYFSFRGKEPSMEAFLERSGLK
jgi:peptidyl-dipeptidase Dcp